MLPTMLVYQQLFYRRCVKGLAWQEMKVSKSQIRHKNILTKSRNRSKQGFDMLIFIITIVGNFCEVNSGTAAALKIYIYEFAAKSSK